MLKSVGNEQGFVCVISTSKCIKNYMFYNLQIQDKHHYIIITIRGKRGKGGRGEREQEEETRRIKIIKSLSHAQY